MAEHYDLVVIGSGLGGVGASLTAASLGKRVAMVDRESMTRSAPFSSACWHTRDKRRVRTTQTLPLLAAGLDRPGADL